MTRKNSRVISASRKEREYGAPHPRLSLPGRWGDGGAPLAYRGWEVGVRGGAATHTCDCLGDAGDRGAFAHTLLNKD